MKSNQIKSIIHLVISKFTLLILAIFFSGLLISCLDDDPVPEPDPVAYVSFYHVAPITSLNIILDNNRINTNPFAYTDHTGYLRFFTGDRWLSFTPSNASNTLLEGNLNLVEDSIYSVFITGDLDDPELLIVNDEIIFDDSQNPFIRLLHASPDAPELKLVFTGSDDPTFDDVFYKEISDFNKISSGNVSFEIRNAETDELISEVSNYNFEQQRFYTIVVRGYLEAQEDIEKQLSVQVIRNFFNL